MKVEGYRIGHFDDRAHRLIAFVTDKCDLNLHMLSPLLLWDEWHQLDKHLHTWYILVGSILAHRTSRVA